jgi:fibronectin-binding autotransporter adhesin
MKINFAKLLLTMRLAVASLVVSLLTSASAQTTIFEQVFTGGVNAALNGTAVSTGAGTWTATPNYFSDGNVTSGSGAAVLPFTPVQGTIYTLSATIALVNNDANWIGLGFANAADGWLGSSPALSGGNRFAGAGSIPGYSWMITAPTTGQSCFRGPAAGATIVVETGSDVLSGTVNLKIVLDASGLNWTTTFYVDNAVLATANYTGSAPIDAVGFTSTTGASGTVANFLLTEEVAATSSFKSWRGDGAANQWNLTSANWLNGGVGSPVVFVNNDVVLFDDTATNLTVNIPIAISPALVNINSSTNYTFSGSGGIAGTNSLIKNGSGLLTIATANSYTGGTTLVGTGILGLGNNAALGSGPLNLNSARTDSSPTVILTGGLTITNAINIDAAVGREAILSTNAGNTTLTGPITISPGAFNVYFRNDSDPGSVLSISNSINGPAFTGALGLRGKGENSGLLAGQVVINSRIQIFGNTGWTIAATNNSWPEARMSQGNGGFILGANDAMPTNALVRWDSDSSGALDLAGFNQTVAGLLCSSTTSNPPPAVGNSSVTSDSVLKINGAGNAFIGALVDSISAGTRKLSVELLSGTQILRGVNTYTGPSTISGGSLVLQSTGLIPNSPVISVASGATFDVTTVSGGFALNAPQTLKGDGSVVGSLTINGTLMPGLAVGTLLFNNDLTLQGTTIMEIARNGAVLTNDLITGVITLNYGGALIVTNVGGSPLQVGDSFKLFDAAIFNPAFTSIIYPAGYTFSETLAVDGTITVQTAPAAAPTLSFTPSGNNWVFTWPGTGFKLQAQTNTLAVGLSNNWGDVPGGNISGVSVPAPVAGNPAVFFRLISTP